MKRPLSDIIGRKLLVHLHKAVTTILKKHNSRLVIKRYSSSLEYQSKTEYSYRFDALIYPMHAFNYRYVTFLLTVSDSELTINMNDYGCRTLNITDKEAIDKITKFVQEACKTTAQEACKAAVK